MITVSKKVYNKKLGEIVHKYNNKYHRTVNMKPVNVQLGTYIDYSVAHNDKDPKFNIGDHVIVSRYKNIFAKGSLCDQKTIINPFEHYGGNMKSELNVSSYAMKDDLKRATGIDTSTLASKKDLASLNTKVDNLDVNKIKTVPAALSKLSNVVDNDVIKKKIVYDKSVFKVNAIVTKTQHDSDKEDLEKKIEDVEKKIANNSRLVTNKSRYLM